MGVRPAQGESRFLGNPYDVCGHLEGHVRGLLMSYALRLFPLAEALVDAPVRALTLRTAIESLREKSEYVFTATAAAAQRPRDEIRARPWIPEPISGFANKTSKAPTG